MMIRELAALAENRKLVRAAATAMGLMFAFVAMLYVQGDARLADGKLTAAEFSWWELLLISLGVGSTLLLWSAGAAHSWSVGRRAWFAGAILVWPVGIVYALTLDSDFTAK